MSDGLRKSGIWFSKFAIDHWLAKRSFFGWSVKKDVCLKVNLDQSA